MFSANSDYAATFRPFWESIDRKHHAIKTTNHCNESPNTTLTKKRMNCLSKELTSNNKRPQQGYTIPSHSCWLLFQTYLETKSKWSKWEVMALAERREIIKLRVFCPKLLHIFNIFTSFCRNIYNFSTDFNKIITL